LVKLNIYPTLDPHRSRRFNLDTFDHSETLQALAAQTQAKRLAKPERLIKFAGETTTPTNRLLLDAIYIRPDLSIPLGRPDYITFQEECLSEMTRVMEQIDRIKRNAIETLQHHIEKVQRDVESDKGLSADQCAKVVAELTSIQAEALANLDQLYLKCMRSEIEEALEAEDKLAAQFADLVEEARRLQEPIGRELAEQQIERVAEDGESLTPEYIACIQARLDRRAVDRLLWQTILRFEEVYGLEPMRGLQLVDLPENIDEIVSPGEDEFVLPDDLDAAIEQEILDKPEFGQYLGFWSAYLSTDTLEKWSMVCWITAHLANRNECVRLLQREAEGVYHQYFLGF
jgi:hypothetical protein